MLKIQQSLGDVIISQDVIASLVSHAAMTCFGVVGMASRNPTDGIVSLLRKEGIEKGVKVVATEDQVKIDVHIIVTYGVNIPAITESITNEVSYVVENTTGFKVDNVSVYVDSMRNKE